MEKGRVRTRILVMLAAGISAAGVISANATDIPEEAVGSFLQVGPQSAGAERILTTKDPRIVYLLDGGTLYRSEDAGDHFHAVHPYASSGIVSLADVDVDPGNALGLVAAGQVDKLGEYRILRSSDGGHSWAIANTPPLANPRAVQFHPSSPHIVIAADRRGTTGGAYGGVLVSMNRGADWFRAAPTLPHFTTEGVEFLPAYANTFFAFGEDFDPETADIAVAYDNGRIWEEVTIPQAMGSPESFSVSADPSPVILMSDGSGLLARSEDHGDSWSQIAVAPSVTRLGEVVFAPSDPQVAYVAVDDTTDSDLESGVGVYRSDDAGKSWRPLAGIPNALARGTAVAVDPLDADRIFASPDFGVAGVFRSEDGGSTWRRATQGTSFHNVRDVLQVTLGNGRKRILAMLDNAGVVYSDDYGKSWSHTLQSELTWGGSEFLLDPATPGSIYLRTVHPIGGLLHSSDYGDTWTRLDESGLDGLALYGIAVRTRNGVKELLVGTGDGLMRSTDGGRNFTPVAASGLGPDDLVYTMTQAPGAPDLIYARAYAADSDRRQARSTDFGASWEFPDNNISNLAPYTIAVDPFDADRVMIINNVDLYLSEDRMESWSKVHSVAYDVVFHPELEGVVIALGFAALSTDGGHTWKRIDSGLGGGRSADMTRDGIVISGISYGGVKIRRFDGLFADSFESRLEDSEATLELASAPSACLPTNSTVETQLSIKWPFGPDSVELAWFAPDDIRPLSVPASSTTDISTIASFDLFGGSEGTVPISVLVDVDDSRLAAGDSINIASSPARISRYPTLVHKFGALVRWATGGPVDRHHVQLSTTSDFTEPFFDGWVTGPEVVVPELPADTIYWRAATDNPCGQSEFSPVIAVGGLAPAVFVCDDTQLQIPAGGTVYSDVFVSSSLPAEGLKVLVQGSHPRVFDLRATLTHRDSAKVASLFYRNCGDVDDFDVLFGDDAPVEAEDAACPTDPPGLAGYQHPNDDFARRFEGQTVFGQWELGIQSLGEAGTLDRWCLIVDDPTL